MLVSNSVCFFRALCTQLELTFTSPARVGLRGDHFEPARDRKLPVLQRVQRQRRRDDGHLLGRSLLLPLLFGNVREGPTGERLLSFLLVTWSH